MFVDTLFRLENPVSFYDEQLLPLFLTYNVIFLLIVCFFVFEATLIKLGDIIISGLYWRRKYLKETNDLENNHILISFLMIIT